MLPNGMLAPIPIAATFNPFVSHAFLKALEDSRAVGRATGWLPRHLVLEDEDGKVAAAAPAYVKSHSQGEYVFDHSWADAYAQAGGQVLSEIADRRTFYARSRPAASRQARP